MAKEKFYAVKVTVDSAEITVAEPNIIEAACQLAISLFHTCNKLKSVQVVGSDSEVVVNLIRS